MTRLFDDGRTTASAPRRHFAADLGTPDHDTYEALAARGLMVRRGGGSLLPADRFLFLVTRQGAAAVGISGRRFAGIGR